MAESIAAFARNAKRQQSKPMQDAVKAWEQDLRFLYNKFYVGHFGFGWPTSGIV